jgi:predicted GNAT family acetyltransferase
MQVRHFTTAQDFLDRATPFLATREAEHNRVFGICNNIAQGAAHFDEPMYFATVEDGGRVTGAAIRTPPFQLHLSRMDPGVLPLLASDVMAALGAIPAVVGETALSRAFAEEWSRITGLTYHVGMETRIFQLTAVRPVKEASGSFRRAQEGDRDLLVEWMEAFHSEALGHSVSHSDRERVASEVELDLRGGPRGLYLWEDDGAPVSMAGYSGPTPNGIRVLGVYTPPRLRGRGYATTCVAALSRRLLEGGRKFVFLFTDLTNPTSNHIYQEIGYEPVCDVTEYRFG